VQKVRVLADEVVFPVGVIRHETQWIGTGNRFRALLPEFSIRAGIMEVPAKLVANAANLHSSATEGDFVHPPAPERQRETEQKNRFNEDHARFEVGRGMAANAMVISLRVAALMKPPDGE